ncbi:hypothetical protein MVEN_02515600 [Mycena venus]|uniref:Uncharacterized protein n=1 Tax=Mycena venus TaxID=2733690 RepID=A0A8H6WUJ2_9AGAR|nr:hypothetical protein MVEN_02515600 [Mycena venus]
MAWVRPRDLTIRPVLGLGDDDLSAIVSGINVNPLDSLWMEQKTNIRHSDLLLFLHHHPNLQALGLRRDSLRPSSLTTPDPSALSWITSLSTPALYIPHLIPVTPDLTNITIEFLPVHIFASKRVAFSVPQYERALDCVASLPGSHALTLTLSFPPDESTLPWLNNDYGGANPLEARLSRVTDLLVSGNLHGMTGFSTATLRALPPWLRLFPGLRRFTVIPGSRQSTMLASERQELVKAITDACPGVEDVTV